jgi:protein O-mannosyl-transferase
VGNRPLPRHVLTRPPVRDRRLLIAAGAAITLLTLAVFWPVRHFEFVNYDDLEFVVENPHVATGLTGRNIVWAFANPYAATGGPLTWISHMLDVEMFGMDAGPHHVTSLVLHLCNSALLLALLWRMTAAIGPSVLVAALFAVHPLHVESVAWVSERKDVLSTLFWLLTMWAYVSYTRRPSRRRYAAVLTSFTFGLLSKPMVATLPFVLLLLDLWPLGRLQLGAGFRDQARRLAREKLPLLALAAGCIVMTVAAQRQIGAVAGFEDLPLGIRLSNAALSYVEYIGEIFWPQGLAPFYPYRASPSIAICAGCAAALAAMTTAALVAVRRAPYVTVGWLWYVGTLVPVIGIVQIGGHAMADRFTYIPLIGIFVLLAWSGAALGTRVVLPRAAIIGTAALLVIASAVVARSQVSHWRNGIALWQHTTRVSRDNARAHANLGVALARDGQRDSAITEYREALRLDSHSAATHNNLALALVETHQPLEALAHYQEAVRLQPDYPNAHTNLANLLDEQGRSDEAILHYREAIRLNPELVLARLNLAVTLARMGRAKEAIAQLEDALRVDPSNGPARSMLADLRTF